MKFELTQHAKRAMAERGIAIEWVERTLTAPELRLLDLDDADVERYTGKFPNLAGGCCGWPSTPQLNPTGW